VVRFVHAKPKCLRFDPVLSTMLMIIVDKGLLHRLAVGVGRSRSRRGGENDDGENRCLQNFIRPY
jgi:hypothetical protein